MSWTTNKTSADYTPAVYLAPGQPPRDCNVKAVRLVSVAQARELLEANRAAWVSAAEWREAGQSLDTLRVK